MNHTIARSVAILVLAILVVPEGTRAAPAAATRPALPAGRGLAQHDLLYAGEGGRDVRIIRGGKIAWTCRIEEKGGVKDAVMLSSGHVLVAFQSGVMEIGPDRKTTWRYAAPEGCEIHTVGPIGRERAWFIQNGPAAKCMIVHKATGRVEREFALPSRRGAHMQTRRGRLTPAGTLLVAHMDLDKVCEYDADGGLVWSAGVDHPWMATRLPGGNTLVFDETHQVAVEVNPKGEKTWQFSMLDAFGRRTGTQTATPLAGGNILLNLRFGPPQLIEVRRDGRIVWALDMPSLGSCTTIQVLDGDKPAEDAHFGPFR